MTNFNILLSAYVLVYCCKHIHIHTYLSICWTWTIVWITEEMHMILNKKHPFSVCDIQSKCKYWCRWHLVMSDDSFQPNRKIFHIIRTLRICQGFNWNLHKTTEVQEELSIENVIVSSYKIFVCFLLKEVIFSNTAIAILSCLVRVCVYRIINPLHVVTIYIHMLSAIIYPCSCWPKLIYM